MRIDIEALVIAYLREHGFNAYAQVPDGKLIPKPDEFVVVEMTSSSTNGVGIGEYTLAVQSWVRSEGNTPTSRYQASELAARVDRVMFGLVDNTRPITHVYRNALYNYPTSQDEPRYQGTYELVGHIDKED